MAKKKKGKKNDARGYGQSSGPSSTNPSSATKPKGPPKATPVVSSKAHQDMKSLLGQMQLSASNETQATSTADVKIPPSGTAVKPIDHRANKSAATNNNLASNRFASKLASIVDELLTLGFSQNHIEEVAKALQYTITLDSALDWLCLHLPTLELPPLFTDGRIRDSLTTVTNDTESLTVLRFAKPNMTIATSPSSIQENTAASIKRTPSPSQISKIASEKASEKTAVVLQKQREQEERTKKEAAEAAERKAFLLQQYQYEDEGEAHQFDSKDDSTTTEKASAAEIAIGASLSPEELYLAEQEQELAEFEADANNEANNYMRTKQEIKQLQSQLRQKRQLVNGIRKRIAKSKAKQEQKEREEQAAVVAAVAAAAASTETAEADEDIEDCTFALDLFGGSDDEDDGDVCGNEAEGASNLLPTTLEPVRSTMTAATNAQSNSLDASIPKDWTGTTPQKTLLEYCRKEKLPRPQFTQLPQREGYQLKVNFSFSGGKNKKKKNPSDDNIRTWRAYHRDFVKGSALQDYLALEALYEIDSTLPLYRLFPPTFRNVWLSWQQELSDSMNEEVRAQEGVKKERLDSLLTLIKESARTDPVVSELRTLGEPNDLSREMDDSNSKQDDESVLDWEDMDGANEHQLLSNYSNVPSMIGEKLHAEFQSRQSTVEYKRMLQVRSTLPMTAYREQLLDTIAKNPVTILSAQTGAGKTTQCPQFLLEQALLMGRGDCTQILVTQPRRVAATSVAERVAEEICESRVGRWVGYQIRMEAKKSSDTKLLFCTTGVVLRRLQDDRDLQNVTHVIVDEVHERQQQTDVLLIALRQLQRTTRPDLKIILMSATLDSNLFCSFFGDAPLISVPGRTFPVSDYHLEDLIDATDHIIEEGSRYALRSYGGTGEKATLWVTNRGGDKRREVVDLVSQTDVQDVSDLYPGYKMATRRTMDRVNEEVINYDLLEDVLDLILCQSEHNSTLLPPEGADLSKGSVLIFLPGLGEIRSLTERLQGSRKFRDSNLFEIIPMHSTLSPKDQRRAFIPSKSGCRKIILSTNIAETSVTIPDVVCVIDTGRVREIRRNTRTSTSILATDWCSKASAKQRAGRAGRVQPGLCLKLYSSRTAREVMKPASEPELRRVPLEEVCLSILASGHSKSCMGFLSQAPQPPSEDSVNAAVNVLKEVGAIEVNDYPPSSKKRKEKLTPLGFHLAKLPVDVRLGKMLIFGALFRCMDKALTIAASLSSQSPFSTFFNDTNAALAKQQAFADSDSDFITLCNVWESYTEAARVSVANGRKFCQKNFLSFAALREIGDARSQFLDLLCGIGFIDKSLVSEEKGHFRVDSVRLKKSIYNTNGNNEDLLHAVICAGLYPNVARLDHPTTGPYILRHKDEPLYFHKSSVNSRKKRLPNSWLVFHEKFGTQQRVSVSKTCFVHPFALLLLGGEVVVQHTERAVIVDGWIQISMAAQIGVVMKELRKQVDVLLLLMIDKSTSKRAENMGPTLIQGIVNLLNA